MCDGKDVAMDALVLIRMQFALKMSFHSLFLTIAIVYLLSLKVTPKACG